jgi:uncharacterized membrane protein
MEIAHTKNRMEQFSDGIFAIAITLLALDLHVMHLSSFDFIGGLNEISVLLPNIVTFMISFITIAIFWVNHHQLTQDIKHMHRTVLWANIIFLLFITLIPFGTNVASTNPTHPLALTTYALVLFGASVLFSILRYYVHKGLGEEKISMERSMVGPFLYLCAVIVALIHTPVAYFLLVIPPLYYFLPKARQQ